MRSPLLALALAAPLAAAPLPPPATLTPYEADAREILRIAVATKTSVGLGQVPVLVDYLATRFKGAGFPESDIHVVKLGETASLVVRYRGEPRAGEPKKKPIAFLGHMDVVTAIPADWQRDPFTLVEENGYFYGRGTSDDKNTVALLTATFLRLKAEGFVPTRDLILVLTGDEETEQETVLDLVTNHRDLVDAEYALNGDAGGGSLAEGDGRPISYGIQTAEKTYVSFDLTVRNPGGHSSLPRRDNAIYRLADALKALQAYRFPVMWNDTTLAAFRAAGPALAGPLGQAMRRFAANPHDAAAAKVLSDNPSYVGMTRTTCIPTLLKAGHAENALPQAATATINCRIFPGVKVEEVKAQLQKLAGTGRHHHHAREAAGERRLAPPRGRPGGSDEGGPRAEPGRSRLPVPGVGRDRWPPTSARPASRPTASAETFSKKSDVFAHGLNERIPVKSFYDGLEHWHVLILEVAGPR